MVNLRPNLQEHISKKAAEIHVIAPHIFKVHIQVAGCEIPDL